MHKKSEAGISKNAFVLEKSLQAFGIQSRVAVVNVLEEGIRYCVDLALGTKVNDVLDLEKDIALAFESPTGKIYI